jgi:hypothetical protein
MQEQDETRTVDRRRLLRRAGTIAVGAAGVTAAGAVVAAPAQADPGDNVVIGAANTGADSTTTLTSGTEAKPTVRLENPVAGGSALSVKPGAPTSVAAPAGSVFVDEFGDFAAIGDLNDTQGPFVNYAYSPTWATMVVPIRPVRWLDTRSPAGRAHIVPGSATFDSSGRVVPKNSNTTPDLILDLSDLLDEGFAAVQANLTVAGPAAGGWASLWDSGSFPGTSTINYGSPLPAGLANFTQTVVQSTATRRSIRLKTSRAAHFFLDIVGFVVTDPFAQLIGAATMSARAAGPSAAKRRPPKR